MPWARLLWLGKVWLVKAWLGKVYGNSGVGAACISMDTPPALTAAADDGHVSSRLCMEEVGAVACGLACDTAGAAICVEPWARLERTDGCCDCCIATGEMRAGVVSLPWERVWLAETAGEVAAPTAELLTAPTGEGGGASEGGPCACCGRPLDGEIPRGMA